MGRAAHPEPLLGAGYLQALRPAPGSGRQCAAFIVRERRPADRRRPRSGGEDVNVHGCPGPLAVARRFPGAASRRRGGSRTPNASWPGSRRSPQTANPGSHASRSAENTRSSTRTSGPPSPACGSGSTGCGSPTQTNCAATWACSRRRTCCARRTGAAHAVGPTCGPAGSAAPRVRAGQARCGRYAGRARPAL